MYSLTAFSQSRRSMRHAKCFMSTHARVSCFVILMVLCEPPSFPYFTIICVSWGCTYKGWGDLSIHPSFASSLSKGPVLKNKTGPLLYRLVVQAIFIRREMICGFGQIRGKA